MEPSSLLSRSVTGAESGFDRLSEELLTLIVENLITETSEHWIRKYENSGSTGMPSG